jgi:hypothetical protein
MSEALATWENLEVLRQCFPAAPTWGQVGSQEGGNVSSPPSGSQEPTENMTSSRPKRILKPSVRFSNPEWQ